VICPKSLKEQWKKDAPASWPILTKEEFKKHALGIPPYDTVIVDEAHYFSNYKSQMTKSLLKYVRIRKPKNIYLLTGTPYLSTIWNIYSLGLILGMPAKKKWWTWPFFRKSFFIDIPMGRRKVPKQLTTYKGRPLEDAVAELVKMMGNTVRMDECVDVPEQVFQEEYFELTKEQHKAIEDLDDTEPIVRWTKTHQICGGTLKGDAYTPNKTFKSEKLDRLIDIVKQNKKLMVVCRYNNEIKYLYENIKKIMPTYVIMGETKNRHLVVKEADAAPSCCVLANAACSEGYNLPSIPLMVFYSYDFSLKNYIQIKGRIQRINKIKRNVYLSLITKGEIDHDVYKCIQRKQDFDVSIYEIKITNKCMQIIYKERTRRVVLSQR
jgi:hypothetical protein